MSAKSPCKIDEICLQIMENHPKIDVCPSWSSGIRQICLFLYQTGFTMFKALILTALALSLVTVPTRADNGLFTKYRIIGHNDGLADNKIKSIVKDSLGTCWVGTTRGINRIFEGRVINYSGTPAYSARTSASSRRTGSRTSGRRAADSTCMTTGRTVSMKFYTREEKSGSTSTARPRTEWYSALTRAFSCMLSQKGG